MRLDTSKTPGLRAERKARLLTQRALAEMADVSPFTVTRAERGDNVSFGVILALSKSLGVEPCALTEPLAIQNGEEV